MEATINRELEIQKISKTIQKNIDKLKKLNCSVDWSQHSLSVFDNKIPPKKGLPMAGDDYDNAILFSFNTSRL